MAQKHLPFNITGLLPKEMKVTQTCYESFYVPTSFVKKITARWRTETHTSCHPWKVCSHLALMYQLIQITQNQRRVGHMLSSVQPELRARE